MSRQHGQPACNCNYTCYWAIPQDGAPKKEVLLSLLLLDPWCCHSPTGPALHRLFMCKVSSEDARSSRHTNINVLRDASNQRSKSSTVEFTDQVDSWFYCFSSNTVKQTPLNVTSAESVLENRTSIWMIFYVKFTRSLPASCWINSLSIRSELRSVWNIGAKRFRQHILLEDSHFNAICVFIRVKQFRASHPRITSLIRPNPVQAGGRGRSNQLHVGSALNYKGKRVVSQIHRELNYHEKQQ